MAILVLHASSLHLGFLGCYGNTWIATPNLDRLAAEGIVFDHHYADNLGQRTSWRGQFQRGAAPLQPLLPNLLQTNGCRFAHVASQSETVESDGSPLERTLEAAVETIEQLAGKPRWLCWVDLPSLHPPWTVSEQFTQPYLAEEPDEDAEEEEEPLEPLLAPLIGPIDRDDLILWERLHCTYAGAVTYLDAGLGLLFDELKERRLFDDMTIIFTADRGLALGEHGIVGDSLPWLHDELVHLALIVRQPGGKDGGLRIDGLTQSVDLTATLLELLGIDPPPMDGRSLLPLLAGKVDAVREQCITTWNLACAEEWSLRTLGCALLVPVKQSAEQSPRPVQYFLKPEDRWELNNVIQHHMEVTENLETQLRLRITP